MLNSKRSRFQVAYSGWIDLVAPSPSQGCHFAFLICGKKGKLGQQEG